MREEVTVDSVKEVHEDHRRRLELEEKKMRRRLMDEGDGALRAERDAAGLPAHHNGFWGHHTGGFRSLKSEWMQHFIINA